MEKQFWRDQFWDVYGKRQDFHMIYTVGSSFQVMGAATEKARLPRFSLVLGMEICCEVDSAEITYVVKAWRTYIGNVFVEAKVTIEDNT